MKDVLLKDFIRWLYEGGFKIIEADRISRKIPPFGMVEFSVENIIKLFALTEEYQGNNILTKN